MPKRKARNLFPIEGRILAIGCDLMASGVVEFHGYQLAKDLAGGQDRYPTVGYGTLYRALDRLEGIGYLTSRWEEPAPLGRPRRRLYQVTQAGALAAPSRLPALVLERASA
jgi:DNA-binding PadR family transcriptional regulator